MPAYSNLFDFIAGSEYWFLPSKISGVFKISGRAEERCTLFKS